MIIDVCMYVCRYNRMEFGSEVIPVEAAEATARAAISRTLSQSQAIDAADVVTEMEAKVSHVEIHTYIHTYIHTVIHA